MTFAERQLRNAFGLRPFMRQTRSPKAGGRRARRKWRATFDLLMRAVRAERAVTAKLRMDPAYESLGCSDGGCPFTSHRGGMRTNGGCKCLCEAIPDVPKRRDVERLIRWLRAGGAG